MEYTDFIHHKEHLSGSFGFDPLWIPDKLFDFQKALVEWACRKGRAAIFADCGLGKTFMQLTWAENIVRKTNKRVLILTPLAVAFQTVGEGEKLGIPVMHRRTGIESQDKIVVTNYERLHYFHADDFVATVCDESSILKNFDGVFSKQIIEFMRKQPYRLLCTATAAPNDFIELGTSSEALGYMGFRDMITTFFKKAKSTYSRKAEHMSGTWRFRGHAEQNFWRWVCSWARALRFPSDMGFDDDGFILPNVHYQQHIVKARTLPDGYLFELPAANEAERRNELSRTVQERCEKSAELLMQHNKSAVGWCYRIAEGRLLAKLIPDAVNVEGNDSEEDKEEAFKAFVKGELRVIISKPSIAGFGMNWQHCSHMTYFPSHSYEQYYQSMRRMWRFGQKQEVAIDIISTEGQQKALRNLQRKTQAAEKMFECLIQLMNNELQIQKKVYSQQQEQLPGWL